MKRRILKSLSMLLAVVVVLSVSISAAAQDTNLNLKPSILIGITREKLDPNSPSEVDKGSYLQDKSTVLNSKSKNILKSFNVNYDDIKSVEVIQNNDLNITENRAKIGNTSVDFDEDGNIVQFINYNDISTVNKDNDIKGGEPLPQETYQINSASDLSSIINNIVTANDLQGYKLVTCSNSIEGEWLLTWNKDLGNGVTNPCDVAVASIDAKNGSVMVFDRSVNTSSTSTSNVNTSSSNTPNTTIPIVTKDEAIKFAQPVISKLGITENINANLTVTKPNFYWEDGGPYKEADFARLAWKVAVGNTAEIMVDAQTGEILGGSKTLATPTSREICAVPTFYMAQDKATWAYTGMGKLGYSRVAAVTNSLSQDYMNAVFFDTNPSVTALYLSCHGSATELSDNTIWWHINASDLGSHYWHFVFLDACETASTTNFANAMHCNQTKCCFVGWNDEILLTTSATFDTHFWDRVTTMPIYNDVVASRDQSLAEGQPDCDPGFHGDHSYYGTSY